MEQNNSQSFIFTRRDKSFSVIRWVLDARSQDTLQFMLRVLHVQMSPIGAPFEGKKVMVATDGKRLHIAEVKGLDIPEGDYKTVVDKRSELVLSPEYEVSYPQWTNATPSTIWEDPNIDRVSFSSDKDQYGQDVGLFYAKLLSKSTHTMNVNFLKPLADGTIWEMLYNTNVPTFGISKGIETVQSVSFRDDNRYAVIATMYI